MPNYLDRFIRDATEEGYRYRGENEYVGMNDGEYLFKNILTGRVRRMSPRLILIEPDAWRLTAKHNAWERVIESNELSPFAERMHCFFDCLIEGRSISASMKAIYQEVHEEETV